MNPPIIEIKVCRNVPDPENEYLFIIDYLDNTPSIPFCYLGAAVSAKRGVYKSINQSIADLCPDGHKFKVFVGDKVLGPYDELDRATFVDILDNNPDSRMWKIIWWTD